MPKRNEIKDKLDEGAPCNLTALRAEVDALRDRWQLKWNERDDLVAAVHGLVNRAFQAGARSAP